MGWTLMQLTPSDIHYTQDSIKATFEKPGIFEGKPIGETVDELCDGVTKISDIEQINVFKKDGLWWSTDNRRLWVFRQYERLGGCDKVTVKVFDKSNMGSGKFSTKNGGESVRVRGNPGGKWCSQPAGSLRRHKPRIQVNHRVADHQGGRSISEWNYQCLEHVGNYCEEGDEMQFVNRGSGTRPMSEKKQSSWSSSNKLLLAGGAAVVCLFNLLK